MSSESLLEYYRQYGFNPTRIDFRDKTVWDLHLARRFNLYQRHLGIPLSLLRNRSVAEFGCGSGENSLVFALAGADLTLVEPNEQVLPRLKRLFKEFGLENRIVNLVEADISTFKRDVLYDVIIAEGFLYTLPNRDEMFHKIAGLLAPGGLAVVSFNDRYGSLMEFTRRMLLWRACQLAEVSDIRGMDSLEIARQLYADDFAKLSASRSFEAWWKDGLVNPFYSFKYLWSYPEILSLIDKEACEFYSSSPKWTSADNYKWYKNVPDKETRNRDLLSDWNSSFSFFLTGLSTSDTKSRIVDLEVRDSVLGLMEQISKYTTTLSNSIKGILYPSELNAYFEKRKDLRLRHFGAEMKNLYEAARSFGLKDLIAAYHGTKLIRNLWGVPYQYVCFERFRRPGSENI